jgi:Icc-related predicted phosphoesterase
MRLLAISDIHGNVDAVHRLRGREDNAFNAVVVAGDIGGDAAAEIMDILVSFACPVLYIYGNWDRRLPYDSDFGPTCHHLHLRSVECCGWNFAGISGLPTSWGLNPIAATLRQDVNL